MSVACNIVACTGESFCRGMCTKHYQRSKKHGDPLAVQDRIPVGTWYVHTSGYVVRTNEDGELEYQHVHVAERALGRKLPVGAEVHHVDENRQNNVPTNLVVCPSHAYHMMLHQRMRAYDACGHADWRKCAICKTYSPPREMQIAPHAAFHPACRAAYERNRVKQRAIPAAAAGVHA